MLIDVLAAYAHKQHSRELPQAVIHHAKRALLDWCAALLAGTRVSPAVNLVRAHRAELGCGRSSLPGFGTTAFAATAAWINGSASHAVEFDDIYREAIYHPGSPTIAAALAVAEECGASGLDLLRAITVGYEISTRIGVAIQPAHYRFFHTTGTVGCFGGASAAAFLLATGDAAVMRHALATAASLAAGLQQAFRSDAMTKPLHAGHAAWVGVSSARGAASGVTGALDVLEGQAGFGAALCGEPRWEALGEGLGREYNITRVTQKNHGCCGHTFSAIDAVLRLREEHGIDPAQVASILVECAEVPIQVAGNPVPRTPHECKFSLPFVVAHALVHGSVRLDAFSAERIADPDLRRLMERVSLRADPELNARFPGMRSSRVTIRLRDGEELGWFQAHRKGDPEDPLSDRELENKFMELAAPVIGSKPARGLMGRLWGADALGLAELGLAGLKAV